MARNDEERQLQITCKNKETRNGLKALKLTGTGKSFDCRFVKFLKTNWLVLHGQSDSTVSRI